MLSFLASCSTALGSMIQADCGEAKGTTALTRECMSVDLLWWTSRRCHLQQARESDLGFFLQDYYCLHQCYLQLHLIVSHMVLSGWVPQVLLVLHFPLYDLFSSRSSFWLLHNTHDFRDDKPQKRWTYTAFGTEQGWHFAAQLFSSETLRLPGTLLHVDVADIKLLFRTSRRSILGQLGFICSIHYY